MRQGGAESQASSELFSSPRRFHSSVPKSHQWVSTGQTRDRKMGTAQGFYPFDFRPVSPRRDEGSRVE